MKQCLRVNILGALPNWNRKVIAIEIVVHQIHWGALCNIYRETSNVERKPTDCSCFVSVFLQEGNGKSILAPHSPNHWPINKSIIALRDWNCWRSFFFGRRREEQKICLYEEEDNLKDTAKLISNCVGDQSFPSSSSVLLPLSSSKEVD